MFSLDVLFCHVDDFCQTFEAQWHKQLLKHEGIKRIRATRLCLSDLHDDSHSVSSKSLPQFQAFLFKSGETVLAFGVSGITKLSTIC